MLERPVSFRRFRPNLVVNQVKQAYDEDHWSDCVVGGRAGGYEKALRGAKEAALEDIAEEAAERAVAEAEDGRPRQQRLLRRKGPDYARRRDSRASRLSGAQDFSARGDGRAQLARHGGAAMFTTLYLGAGPDRHSTACQQKAKQHSF